MLLKGYRSVYLGPSVPIESLKELQNVFKDVTFISYFTVSPSIEKLDSYLEDINSEILNTRNEKLHIIGRNTKDLDLKNNSNIKVHSSILDLISAV